MKKKPADITRIPVDAFQGVTIFWNREHKRFEAEALDRTLRSSTMPGMRSALKRVVGERAIREHSRLKGRTVVRLGYTGAGDNPCLLVLTGRYIPASYPAVAQVEIDSQKSDGHSWGKWVAVDELRFITPADLRRLATAYQAEKRAAKEYRRVRKSIGRALTSLTSLRTQTKLVPK